MQIGFSNRFKEKFAIECLRSPIWKQTENITRFFTYFANNNINFDKLTAEQAKKITVIGIYNIGETSPLVDKKYTSKHVFFRNNLKFDWLLANKKEEFLIDAIFTRDSIIFINLFNNIEEKAMTEIILNDKKDKSRIPEYETDERYASYIETLEKFQNIEYEEQDDTDDSIVMPDIPLGDDTMYKSFTLKGNGRDKTFQITHNLNTKNILTDVYDANTGSNVIVEIVRESLNTILVKFEEVVAESQKYGIVIIAGKEQ